MQDFYSSRIGVHTEIEYRRRLIASLCLTPSIEPRSHSGFRATLVKALAHLALHLDGRSIGAVAAQHTPQAGHGHGRAA